MANVTIVIREIQPEKSYTFQGDVPTEQLMAGGILRVQNMYKGREIVFTKIEVKE